MSPLTSKGSVPIVVLSLFIVVSVLSFFPTSISRLYSNVAALRLRDLLACDQKSEIQNSACEYHYYPSDIGLIEDVLNYALLLDEDNFSAHWSRLRLSLFSGNREQRVYATVATKSQVGYNPLVYFDVLKALVESGEPNRAIHFYKSVRPPLHTKVITDTVSVAFADAFGNEAASEVISLRPFDIYANYHLWNKAVREGNLEAARLHSERLSYFPRDAIFPEYEPLLYYTLQTIPDLISKGIWDQDKALVVLRTLVWQYPDSPIVADFLFDSASLGIDKAERVSLLAEFYYRAGELDRVIESGERFCIMKGNEISKYSLKDSTCKYGANCEDGFPMLRESVPSLTPYSCSVPTNSSDPGLLSYVCAKDFEIPSDLSKALDDRMDDHRIVAELLELPPRDLSLGPNMVENPDFEVVSGDGFSSWIWSDMYNRLPFNAGSFVGGEDSFAPFNGQYNARINGLWTQDKANRSPARAGFWQRTSLLEDSVKGPIIVSERYPYVISFYYRTIHLSENSRATVWLSDDPDVFWAGDHSLPPTFGTWHHFVAVGWNRSGGDIVIEPLVRLFGVGQVDFDLIQIRPIEVFEYAKIKPSGTLFLSAEVNP